MKWFWRHTIYMKKILIPFRHRSQNIRNDILPWVAHQLFGQLELEHSDYTGPRTGAGAQNSSSDGSSNFTIFHFEKDLDRNRAADAGFSSKGLYKNFILNTLRLCKFVNHHLLKCFKAWASNGHRRSSSIRLQTKPGKIWPLETVMTPNFSTAASTSPTQMNYRSNVLTKK